MSVIKKNTKLDSENSSLKQDIGLITAISIVVGNMIGSGIYGLPSALAKVATPSITILAWISVAVGAIIIALSYGNLSRAIPKAGGPVVYAEAALGNFSGYAVSLIWWVGAAIGNAAIVDLMFTTLAELAPGLNTPVYRLATTLLFLWFFTYINIIGVKFAGWVSITSNILKFIVFALVIFVAIPYFNLDILVSDQIPTALADKQDVSFFTMFAAAIALLFWAFTGLESSTMAGGEIKNPEKNIHRSIIFGLLIVAFIYILLNISLFALVPQSELAQSDSPFADAINNGLGGNYGKIIINFIIMVSLIGTLAGWILVTARSVYAASKDRFFIQAFSKLHPKYSTPHIALIISGIITTIFLILNFYSEVSGNQKMLSHFVNITTVAAFINLPTYVITVIAEYILVKKGKLKSSKLNNIRIILAFIISLVFLYFGWIGSIVPSIYWVISGILLAIGMLCYPIFIKKLKNKE